MKKYNKKETELILIDLRDNYLSKLIKLNSGGFGKIHQNQTVYNNFLINYPLFISKLSELKYLCLNIKDIQNLLEYRFCQTCDNNVNFINGSRGYYSFCCISCSKEQSTRNRKKTNLKKYGCEHVMQNKEVMAKREKTNLERYDETTPLKNKKVKEKIKKTMIERHGADNPMKVKKFFDKMQNTCLELYDAKNVSNSKIIQEKRNKTMIERFDSKCPLANEEIRLKADKTMIERHGFKDAQKCPQIQEQTRKTCLEIYNETSPLKNDIVKAKIKKTLKEKFGGHNKKRHLLNQENLTEKYIMNNFIKDGFFLIDEFCEYFNCGYTYSLTIRNKFNINIKAKKTHKNQNKIYEWIYSFFKDTINDDRKTLNNLELDILIPSKNLAIEYNGLMFHSFGISEASMFDNAHLEDKNKHLIKTNECEKQNIQLLHIFENEWLENKQLWKSMISSKLGLNKRIFARKCEIKEINRNNKTKFLIDNHLQGNVNSPINLGLFHNDELVSVMTFGKPRQAKKYEYELLRFCSLQGLTIVGGASKLLSYFKKTYKPTSIISYANRRWSSGNLYKQLGFTQTHISPPNYFYFKPDERILLSRQRFQKHKLEKLLENFDEELTEKQNMFLNDYRVIYDCGNIAFELILE